MHLSELESKLKPNSSLDVKTHVTSSSSSSLSEQLPIAAFDDIPVHSFNGRGDNDFAHIQREMRDSMMRRETFLDEYCDTIVDGKSAFSAATLSNAKVKKLELASPTSVTSTVSTLIPTQTTNHTHHYGKSNGSVVNRKSTTIDPKKKTSLLAALKNIDDDSLEH